MSTLCICAFQYGSILARFLLLYTTMTKSDLRGKDFSVKPPDAEGVDPILVGTQAGAEAESMLLSGLCSSAFLRPSRAALSTVGLGLGLLPYQPAVTKVTTQTEPQASLLEGILKVMLSLPSGV